MNKPRRPLPANLGKAALDSFRAMKRGEYTPRVFHPAEGSTEIAALREPLRAPPVP